MPPNFSLSAWDLSWWGFLTPGIDWSKSNFDFWREKIPNEKFWGETVVHVQHNTRVSSGSPLPQKMALRSLKEHASDDIQKQRGKLSFAKLVMNITSQRAVLFGAHYGWTGLWHVPQPLHLRQYACSLSFKSVLCLKNRGRSCKPKGKGGFRGQ